MALTTMNIHRVKRIDVHTSSSDHNWHVFIATTADDEKVEVTFFHDGTIEWHGIDKLEGVIDDK